MKEIRLTNGKVTQVDDIDYNFANQYTWHEDENGYTASIINGQKVLLHELIMQRMITESN